MHYDNYVAISSIVIMYLSLILCGCSYCEQTAYTCTPATTKLIVLQVVHLYYQLIHTNLPSIASCPPPISTRVHIHGLCAS